MTAPWDRQQDTPKRESDRKEGETMRGKGGRFVRYAARIGLAIALGVAAVGCVASASGLASAGTPAPEDEVGPEAIVAGFYDWYLGYTEQEGGNPLVDGAYRTRSELTAGLIAEADAMMADREMGGDPFLCAQDIPVYLSIGAVDAQGDAATVTMDALYTGNPLASHFDVVLERTSGAWQIADVVCTFESTPLTPAQTVVNFYALYLQASEQRNLLATGAYRDLPFLSAAFVEKVDGILAGFDGGGYDPILCAQDIPTEVTVVAETVEGREATVEVETSFEGHGFTVRLTQDGDYWAITDVICR